MNPIRKLVFEADSRPSGLRSRNASLATSLLSIDGRDTPPLPKIDREERQNRRALGTSAGEKTGGDGCLHPESSGFSPVTDDPIACRSAGKKRKRPSNSVTASLRLCAFALTTRESMDEIKPEADARTKLARKVFSTLQIPISPPGFRQLPEPGPPKAGAGR